MKRISRLIAFLSLTNVALASTSDMKMAWENISDPEIMSYFFTRTFRDLPLKGEVAPSKKYWSGDYWALRNGNINYRWFAKKKIGWNLRSPTKEEAMRMTIPQLAELAPSEKYDLFTGKYNYPLREEVYRRADPEAEIWEGMCHGWSPATMNHEEPTPKVMRNPDGIEIPFGSSDIKALVSYYYAYGFQTPTVYQMGRRCFKGGFLNFDHDCKDDMNAGAFHIVLTNRIGIDGKGFVADIQRYKEVWNHPINKYSSVIVDEYGADNDAAPGAVKTLQIRTTITYVDENGHDWQPVRGTQKQHEKTANYEYEVELDGFGKIVGGKWLSKARPDFLWLKTKAQKFEGSLSRLGELLND
ncbi:hypothetical protein ACJVC5_15940 [Peredibacter sp. HCB2-198]|uniref:hypothetical protein n=1 Tax=Peredibacter sp. HCB2-198 TaxID=3383025 RepID=UPI0038B61625